MVEFKNDVDLFMIKIKYLDIKLINIFEIQSNPDVLTKIKEEVSQSCKLPTKEIELPENDGVVSENEAQQFFDSMVMSLNFVGIQYY